MSKWDDRMMKINGIVMVVSAVFVLILMGLVMCLISGLVMGWWE